jgi:hypothetical protein
VEASDVARAMSAAVATASELGLAVDDATVVQNSNKLGLCLLPCDVFARVAHLGREVAAFEVDLAQRLAGTGSPVATLDPRVAPHVHQRDGFAMTFWTFYRPARAREIPPAEYARALERLHEGMRTIDAATPHFLDRVAEAEQLVANRDHTPALADEDRDLLSSTLRALRQVVGGGAAEQLLHGEPHPGNVLDTPNGLVFIDLETCCRGPVEFDLAHAPEDISAHYPGVDQDLLRACRMLMRAMITTWRWDRDDQFPNGRHLGTAWLVQLRAALDRDGRRRRGA